ncbi:MAG: hypothetical protein CSA54_04270 [Gammaproteobacteria bacterium]|nr:MAG: hypothetical protein CSA54_04270 [Gammaproteobacteria bacterium]
MAWLWLFLTALGTALPFAAFLPWLAAEGPNLPLALELAAGNAMSRFAWLDVIVAAIALLAFIAVDGKRHAVKHRWTAVLATLCIGVSAGLPWYLFLREKRRDRHLLATGTILPSPPATEKRILSMNVTRTIAIPDQPDRPYAPT